MNLGEESEYIEHKLSTSELSEALQAMSGMLNKHGRGTIFFGVEDSGDAKGFPCGNETENEIARRIEQKISPAPNFSMVLTRFGGPGKGIIEVNFSGERPPYSYNGRYYMRNARKDDPMDPAELERYILARRTNYSQWENAPGDQGIASLSNELIERTYQASKEIKREHPKYPGPKKTLAFFGLLNESGAPNNAAVALFGHRPITLKTAHYLSFDQSEAIDMDVKKGNIVELVEFAQDYILEHTDSYYRNVGQLRREDVHEIPPEALREIVVNAFAHADYSSNTVHQAFVYKDRVSIYNPGYFPIGLKPEDYEKVGVDPVERNPKIYDVLHTLGYVETYATGLRKTFEACRKSKTTYGYEATAQGGFRFTLFRKGDSIYPAPGEGDTDEERILAFLSRNSYMTIEELSKLIRKSRRTVQTRISELTANGRLERVGSDKTGHWLVKGK